MKPLILAMFLAVMQAAPPSPGKTADHYAASSQGIKQNAQAKQNPPAQSKSVKEPTAREPSKQDREEVSNNDTTKTIRVSEFPSLSITRDWTDYAAVLFSGLLIIVGVFGVCFALRTLKAIEAQGKAVILSERAWLVIRPDPFTLQTSARLDWVVTNTGRTVARIVEARIRCGIYDVFNKLPDMPNYGDPINLYRVPIGPGESFKLWSYIETHKSDYPGLTAEDIDDIKTRGSNLIAYGIVRYSDSFGNPHESRFCYDYTLAFGEFRIYLLAPAEYHKCD
jgi:hypothetical protein